MKYYLIAYGKTLNNGKGYESKKEAEYEQGLILINYGYKPEIVKR
jgi:hypothetical protein